MIRHLAAAVVCAMVNLGGAVDINTDGGDDGPAECIELRRVEGSGEPSPLAAASVACGSEIDHAWVLRAHDNTVAAAAVEHPSDYESVVSLTAPRETSEWVELLARSLAFCRDHGALKVVVESVGPRPVDVRLAAESAGFQYSRVRRTDGVTAIEFYTDLYWHGPRDDQPQA